MTVDTLRRFLRSLVSALEGAGDGKAARELGEAIEALGPFDALDLPAFGNFLHRAHAYRADGRVAVPIPGEEHLDVLKQSFTDLHGSADQIASRQKAMADAIQMLMSQAGLKGKLTADAKWAAEREAKAKAGPHRTTLMHLAARIQSPEAFAEPVVQEGITTFAEQVDAGTLKILAAETGVKAGAKTQPAKVVLDMLIKLSGHQPMKGNAKAKPAPVDPAVVEEHSQRLIELIAKSVNPESVSDADIEAEMALLKSLPQPALFEVVTRAGMREARASEKGPALLKRVQNELLAARRARERAEV